MKKRKKINEQIFSGILLTAIQKEISAFNYYYKASQKSPTQEAKSLLIQLAEEERKHRMILLQELHTLKTLLPVKKGGKEFLKKEEVSYKIPDKLPFRRVQSVDNLDLACVSLPTQLVGGDYFESFPIFEKKYQVLLMFDVFGHGLSATLVKAEACSVFEKFKESYIGLSSSPDLFRPSNVVTFMNQKLSGICQRKAIFVGLFYGLFDPEKGELSYISAGHEPPLLVREKENHFSLFDSDLLLGVDKSKVYSEKKIKLTSGDIFILFTDGVAETFGARGKKFKREDIVTIVRDNHNLDSSEIVRKIFDFIKRALRNKTLTDEFSLAVLKTKF